MTTPCQQSVSLGAYLLGALDPEERRAMELHVAGCEHCKAELVELAPLPGLLRHTAFEELPETAAAAESLGPVLGQTAPVPVPMRVPVPVEQSPVEPAPTAPGPVGDGQARQGRRRRRLVTAAGMALAACVAGVAVYAAVGRDNPPAPAARFSAAATWNATDPSTHVWASAAVIPKGWGTQFELKLGGLPSGITCHLVVHGTGGRSETAGTWASGYTPSTLVPAATSISPADITGLDVVDGSGSTLVQVQPG